MAWYWHIWWGGVVLLSAWWIHAGLHNIGAIIGTAFVNIEKERNRRADKETEAEKLVKKVVREL